MQFCCTSNKTTLMGKVSDKKLVGQPILRQIVDIVPRELFDRLVLEHKSDRYYKTYDSWTQFMTLLLGILSRCDSTTEIACGMQALQGKLNYFGLGCISGQKPDRRWPAQSG
jgi:hypothetical protein